MKRLLWVGILILALSTALVGCAPAKQAENTFAGTWTTNVGTVNFVQNGSDLTGTIEGYGGGRNDTFKGTINEKGEATFNTDWFGSFTIVLSGENTFKSTGDLSLCGIRGTVDLPDGCGFSGKWIVPSKSVFLNGSYMILKQSGDKVTGNLYDANNNAYDSFSGTVDWGKGWRANGASRQRGELSLWINAAETGFEFMYGSSGNQQQLCAVRDGNTSAFLGGYSCELQ